MSPRKTVSQRVLMVTSEATPFAKTGGLADAVTALSGALSGLGHDVRILMPRYYQIRRDQLYRHPVPFRVTVGEVTYTAALYEGRLPSSPVPVYFIDHESLFGREGIYGPLEGGDWADNLERFTVLSQAPFALADFLGWAPTIVHAHDWQAALACALLRLPPTSALLPETTGVLTIHNIGYQGVFPVNDLPVTGISWEQLGNSGLLHHNQLNLLRSGITSAEAVTTVSPGYALEIQTPRFGFSLDRVLAERGDAVTGVLNGADYDEWNPETDSHLAVNYTPETVALKSRVKEVLQDHLGLPKEPVPLIGIVSRLATQKGFEELLSPGYGVLPEALATLPLQFVILGSGERRYEHELRLLTDRFPNLAVRIGFSERLAHQIQAASDFLLMPSRYEPCGLNQMYAQRYGTIPIVTATGGLRDTVQPVSESAGTGILIDEACPAAILRALEQVVQLWRNAPNRVDTLRRACMKVRFEWSAAASQYATLYSGALAVKQQTQ